MTENKMPTSERDRELRKREWLTIYLPVLLGAVAVVALILMVAIPGFAPINVGGGPASAGGDAAAIIVLFQALVLGLIPLIILIAFCALFIWLYIRIHPVLKRGQEITEQMYLKVDQVTDSLVSKFYKPFSLSARLSAIKQYIRRSSDV